jgi:hypothetical protein
MSIVVVYDYEKDKLSELILKIRTDTTNLCDNLEKTFGSDQYWDNSLPKIDFLFAVCIEFNNKIQGFCLVSQGDKYSTEKNETGNFSTFQKVEKMSKDSWFVDLICSKPNLGNILLTKVIKLAKNNTIIKYITLSALENVISYYWSQFNFNVSVSCIENKDFKHALQIMKETSMLITRHIENIQKLKFSQKFETLSKGIEQEIMNLEKEVAQQKEKRTEAFLTFVKAGLYKDNMDKKIADQIPFEQASRAQKKKMIETAYDGIYMTLCIDKNENKIDTYFDQDSEPRSGELRRSIRNRPTAPPEETTTEESIMEHDQSQEGLRMSERLKKRQRTEKNVF